jgi:hypothetical protein
MSEVWVIHVVWTIRRSLPLIPPQRTCPVNARTPEDPPVLAAPAQVYPWPSTGSRMIDAE